MNIVREQREQNNSLIKVTVGEKDYGDAVEKSLREYKRKANIPGFRPGMVPMGVIKKMYGKELANEYLDKLNHHFIYKNDETSLANYCASITMYPWLIGGTTSIGGNSTAPTNLKSFCGGFVNMVFMVSSMLSGACATPEFLMYLNYFIGKEYGLDYWEHADKVVDLSLIHI